MNHRLQDVGWSVLLSVGVVGCGGTPTDTTTNCATETRAEPYRAGMEKTGAQGALTVRLVESVPGPPLKGDSDWTLYVGDSGGMAASGAMLTVTPYMPDHRHGTSIKPVTSELGSGQYKVSPLNLFMPGLWTVTIAPRTAGGVTDAVVFSFCIEG